MGGAGQVRARFGRPVNLETSMDVVSIQEAAGTFRAYDADHFAALGLTAGVLAAMCLVARSGVFPRLERTQRAGLAVLAILIFPLSFAVGKSMGIEQDLGDSLPLHLCDLAAITAFFALLWRNPLLCELTYFWGLAGTVQGLLTPDLQFGFPHPSFLLFFLHHGGVVLASCYLVMGLGFRPRSGAVWRVFLWTQLYAAAAGLTNFFLGTNYGYLRAKPAKASLLDYMGDWPWYILVLEAVCLALFLALNAPFRGGERTEAAT